MAKESTKKAVARDAERNDDGTTTIDGVTRNAEGTIISGTGRLPHVSGTKDATVNPGDPGSGSGLDAPGPDEPRTPVIRADTQSNAEGREVKPGDSVIVHTPNPINAMLENRGVVTKLNQDGTVNVEISKGDGGFVPLSSVQASMTVDRSPWFEFPADKA